MNVKMDWPDAPWLMIEGGGSRTWAAVLGDRMAQVSGPTTNIFTAAGLAGMETLGKLLNDVMELAGISGGDIGTVFVAHSGAATNRSAEKFTSALTTMLADLSVRARLVVTSDLVPVLMSEEADSVVAAIAGTGTVFAAHRELSRWARASGADYLLSDEGGGFDLAMCGLRAAIKASDGRGPHTELMSRARQWAGESSELRLSDALYEHVYIANPRSVVAGFARSVLDAARVGDDVALQLTESAAAEFLIGVRTVAEQVGISDRSPCIVISGSLATVDSPLRDAILRKLRQQVAPAAIADYRPEDLTAKAGMIMRLAENKEHLAGLRTILPLLIGGTG